MLCSSLVLARCTLLLLASARMLRTTQVAEQKAQGMSPLVQVVPSTLRVLCSSLVVVELRTLVLHTWLPAGE